ncbi:hypothetical protein ME7_01381 [Bartonella birtlesii LL-WM9]|uniref:Uncharacterized protein n=1 Tax=Bartonella birtlesii LL-WM9 TaxID=1094552 RepID=J1IV14_9HYPH|nr:hypothetical protein ME7_01381 [Bartonella birtlesii LL-WM9]
MPVQKTKTQRFYSAPMGGCLDDFVVFYGKMIKPIAKLAVRLKYNIIPLDLI